MRIKWMHYLVGEPSEQLHRGSRQSGGISRKYYNILLNILLLGGGWVGCSSSNNNSSKIVAVRSFVRSIILSVGRSLLFSCGAVAV